MMPTDTTTIDSVFRSQQETAVKFRTLPVTKRKEKLRRLHRWILDNRSRIHAAVHADFQKPEQEIDSTDIYPITAEINHTLSHIDEWAAPRKVDAPLTLLGTSSEVRLEPRGVCLIIAPWNFPFNLAVGPLVPCLAAGNTAIIKPSEITPNTAALVVEMMKELFPPEEVAVFEGGPEMSTTLLSYPFDHIFFTGSPGVGKIVMRAAAEHLTSVSLELGGKSPTIVHSDADAYHSARRIAFSKFLNNGQTCIAPDHVFVHEQIREKFLGYLKKEVLRMFGDRTAVRRDGPAYGRISSPKHFDRLATMADDAATHGWETLLSGPRDRDSRFFHPTILTGTNRKAMVMQEEVFGPLLPVIAYTDLDEVIREINRAPKALAVYVFTGSRRTADTVANKTSSGSFCHNECIAQFIHPNLPFGGVNNSGSGKSHGYAGYLAFSNEKPFLKQRTGFATTYLFQPPYPPYFRKIIDILLRWF